MRLREIAAFAALLPGVVSAAESDLCNHPEVQRAMGQGECRAAPVLYRVDGRDGRALLATVTPEKAARIYFLQPTEGEVVALGPFRALTRSLQDRIIRELGLGDNAGPVSRIYDTLLEKSAGGHCVVYRMKRPYAGELKNCDGAGNPGGAIGYAPGVTTPKGASKAVCDVVATEGARSCSTDGVQVMAPEVRHDPDGAMYYAIRTVERVGTFLDRKSQYEMRSYRVTAEGGEVRLLGKSAEVCTGSGTCTPLPGGVVR